MEHEAGQVAEALAKLGVLEELSLPGLGALRVKDTPPYRGKNPRTGEVVDVPAKRLPLFIPAPAFAGFSPDDDEVESDDGFSVVSFDFGDALAAQVRASLATSPSLVLPGLGKFLLRERGTQQRLTFVPATELVALLSSGC